MNRHIKKAKDTTIVTLFVMVIIMGFCCMALLPVVACHQIIGVEPEVNPWVVYTFGGVFYVRIVLLISDGCKNGVNHKFII